jgi:hypothetical protein
MDLTANVTVLVDPFANITYQRGGYVPKPELSADQSILLMSHLPEHLHTPQQRPFAFPASAVPTCASSGPPDLFNNEILPHHRHHHHLLQLPSTKYPLFSW